MGTVYIVQGSKNRNLLPAREFGELVILLPANSQIWQNTQETAERLSMSLSDFDKVEDSILAIGDPVAIGIVCAIISERTKGEFRMLKWDRQEHRYYDIDVIIPQKGE